MESTGSDGGNGPHELASQRKRAALSAMGISSGLRPQLRLKCDAAFWFPRNATLAALVCMLSSSSHPARQRPGPAAAALT